MIPEGREEAEEEVEEEEKTEEEKMLDWWESKELILNALNLNLSRNTSMGQRNAGAFKLILELETKLYSCHSPGNEETVLELDFKSFKNQFNFVSPFTLIHTLQKILQVFLQVFLKVVYLKMRPNPMEIPSFS